MADVTKFRGENYYMSNFYPAKVEYEGLTYPNNETAFQAAKLPSNDTVDSKTNLTRQDFTQMDGKGAKRAGRRINLRPDWEDVKDKVMSDIVYNKFNQNPKLADKLMDTGKAKLYEGNYWHDTEWGVDANTLKGQNKLGKIMMTTRTLCQTQKALNDLNQDLNHGPQK